MPSILQNPDQLPLTTNPGTDDTPEELDDDELLLDELELLFDELELEELLDDDDAPGDEPVAEPPHPDAIIASANGIK